MLKNFLNTILVLVIISSAYGQDSLQSNNHYFGIQANQLLRQLVNFGGGTQPVNNPFLMNYSFNSTRNGWGMNMGLGYELQNVKDGDAQTSRDSRITSMAFRVGFDKKWTLSDRWICGLGVDVISSRFEDKTTNLNNFNDDNFVEVETENLDKGLGFGPRFTLMFRISERLFVGTESTFYYNRIKVKGEVTTKSRFTQFDQFGNPSTITQVEFEKNKTTNKVLVQQLPSVLYLTMVF